MKCPSCGSAETKVIDTRESLGSNRRRRECINCSYRFTTYEKVEKKISKIEKRDGRIVDFDSNKITDAVYKALKEGDIQDRRIAEAITTKVIEKLNSRFDDKNIPTVEETQDMVEETLMEQGYSKIAKLYILYRQEREEIRNAKSLIGVKDDLKLSINAIKVIEKRYLLKDRDGKVVETPGQMFRRVANYIAQADRLYDQNADIAKTEEEFYSMMANLEFLPNSPTFTGAGTPVKQLSACFVIPVEDSMEGIFEAVKQTALIHMSGGGTGFSFSRLRPKNSLVMSTKGIASGPLSFMNVFNAATETVKQGGTRRGANMGILKVDHPDIIDFITAKEKQDVLTNFNISVALTDSFMEAVEKNEEYELIAPHTKEVASRINARKVFDLIVTMAWKNGEPGIIFLDRMNRFNPTPMVGAIESTNPCGEVPLLPFESCNLGSINLSIMVVDGEIDWERLRDTVHKAVHFLDNVIDVNKYPLKQIDETTKANRKIGLGVMGFADMLIKLGIAYNSEEAIKTAENVIGFILQEGRNASVNLAEKRGSFPNFEKSIWADRYSKLRNATITTIAPTGTLSIIANCSSGIEPLFAVSYIRNIMDNTELLEVNPLFKEIAKKKGFYSNNLMKLVAKKGSIQNVAEISDDVKKIFVVAHDISPEWHIMMQGAFQKYVDNSISKTVNFPHDATTKDVEDAYMLAYRLGCKGVTIYRDGSRENQVLNIESVHKKPEPKIEQICPECKSKMTITEGCATCNTCGYSVCS